jgi:hypothetical protein
MANTQALCSAFKQDLLLGKHAFHATGVPARSATTADVYKAALYYTSATIDATTTGYSGTGEVSGGGYTTGGYTVTWLAPAKTAGTGAAGSSTTYVTLSAPITISSFTASNFNAVLIYNDTVAGKPAVSVHTFGDQSITAGTFTLTMPTNDQTTGLVRLT